MNDTDRPTTQSLAELPAKAGTFRMRELHRGPMSKQSRQNITARVNRIGPSAVEFHLAWSPEPRPIDGYEELYDIVGVRLVADQRKMPGVYITSMTIGGSAELYPETRREIWLSLLPGMLYPVDVPIFVRPPNGASVTLVCAAVPDPEMFMEIVTIHTTPTRRRTP